MRKPTLSSAELAKLVLPLRKRGLSDRAIAKKLGVSFMRVARV